ncbi:MAG TPA: sugar ABC transporter permease [Candidatus Competibacteraceae bacterium]|nr:sugar ABC transporter permease [Candidatus Competibacteraceae bacterium]
MSAPNAALSPARPGEAAAPTAYWRRPELWLPKLVLAPSFLITLVFIYGFIVWSGYLSFTDSKTLPSFTWVGLEQYQRLWANPRWLTAISNLGVFAVLYIGIASVLGLLLAVLLDQRIRAEGTLRTLYLYPMALSFIVTGTVWRWMLDPGLGLQKVMQDFGFAGFTFDWLVNRDMVIYTVVIAGIWQASGFVMAMFLAGLRGIDSEMIKAAYIDGATLPRIYWRIIIPQMRPVFLSAFVILSHLAIKSFDLVMALTGAGPGYASELPATFMYTHTFTRSQMGLGAASAMMMLMTVAAIMVPYLYSELRGARHERRG